MRTATRIVTPIVRFSEWVFGHRAPGIDLLLGLLSAGWAGLMLFRPHLFDTGAFVGMQWLSDEIWLSFFSSLAAMHFCGVLLAPWRSLRCASCLLSAWIWLSVAVSLARIEVTTGVVAYSIIGAFALIGAIYLQGQPRKAP